MGNGYVAADSEQETDDTSDLFSVLNARDLLDTYVKQHRVCKTLCMAPMPQLHA